MKHVTHNTLLNNVGQLFILFFEKQTHTHTNERKIDSNTNI